LYLSLHKSDGSQIAQARQERRTTLDANIPEDGEYTLLVENLLVDDVPGHVYRIEISDAYAGFSLSAEQTQYTSPQGGTFVVKVLAQRRGYNGPIELAVEGLGDDVKLEGSKLEGGEALLKVTLPPTIAQGDLRHMVILGKAKVGDETVTVPVRQFEQLMTMFPNVLVLPTELENAIAVGVGPPFPPFFDLTLVDRTVVFPQIVGKLTFDVGITRTDAAFKYPVALTVEGLPENIKAEISPEDDGAKAYRVSLTGPVDMPEQEIAIQIVGIGVYQNQTRRVTLDDVKLQVTKPLVIDVSMAGPVAAGGEQSANVRIRRFGEPPEPVRLQVVDGPAGLAAPISVIAPADASELKIPITAAASAVPGKFENLIVVATTTVGGQNVSVRSRPAVVEIQSPSVESPPEVQP
jgi:hypothetical protein